MARSGMSAVAGVLNVLGVKFHPKLCVPSDSDNKKGHYEHIELRKVNTELLKGQDWGSLCCGLELQGSAADEQKEAIRRLLRKDFGKDRLFGLKDPRLVPLLYLYLDILSGLNIKIHCVIVKRRPQSIIDSLGRSSIYDETLAEASTSIEAYIENQQQHVRAMTAFLPRVEVSYDRLISSPLAEIDKISQAFPELNFLVKDKAKQLSNFIDKRMKHF